MEEARTGGCQCGRIRYEVRACTDEAYWCHCRMCQKATGGIAAAFVQVEPANVSWLTEPDWYASSPVARRPFCSQCGTPLGFAWADGTGDMDLTVGSFDDPAPFRPVLHAGCESMHEAWLDTRDLPRLNTASTASVAQRWQAAGLDVPE